MVSKAQQNIIYNCNASLINISKILSITIIILSCFFYQNAFANTPSNRNAIPKKKFQLRDRKGNRFVCGLIGNSWISGNIVKKHFISDSSLIEKLRSALIKNRSSKEKRRLNAEIVLKQSRAKSCMSAASSKPVAINSSFASLGIAPIAVSLPGSSGRLPSTLRCIITSEPVGAKLESFNKEQCTAILRPTNHLTSGATFNFIVQRTVDGRKSAPATYSASWNQNSPFVGDYQSLAHYRDTLMADEAAHLIRTFGQGANFDNFIKLAASPGGTDALVDKLLTKHDCPTIEQNARALANAYQTRFDYTSRKVDPTDPEAKRTLSVSYRSLDTTEGRTSATPESESLFWLYMMRYGCNPGQESMGQFMHTQFPVNTTNYRNQINSYITSHLNLLRSEIPAGVGKIVAPLGSIVTRLHGADGAMLKWLNNDVNQRGNFGNENYARELLELFLLGSRDIITRNSNYNEEDIYQLAFAVMGYTEEDRRNSTPVTLCCTPNATDPLNYCAKSSLFPECFTDSMSYKAPVFKNDRWNHPTRPDPVFLFQSAQFGKYDVFKANSLVSNDDNVTSYLLQGHPGTARYIAARLITTYTSLTPSDAMVSEIASLLRNSNFAFEPALKKILTSSAFYSAEGKEDCVSSPIEYLTTLLRSLDLPTLYSPGVVNIYKNVRDAAISSGEALLAPPSVFGYKSCGKITGNNIHNGTAWLATQPLLARKNGVNTILNEISRVSTQIGFTWRSIFTSEEIAQRSPMLIINTMALKLGVVPTEKERAILQEYLTTLSLASTPTAGQMVPVNWSTLTEQQYFNVLNLKIPGLIEVMSSMKTALTK
jgi:hypothetical protein